MKATIRTQLNIPAKKAWELAKQSKTLVYVCRGLLGFTGSSEFPDHWKEGDTINTRLTLFGLIPVWKHSIHFQSISDDLMVIYTEEKGGIVRSWNHEIKFEELDQNTCLYTDSVDIKAGLFTPLIWAYANLLYRYRQRRWKKLDDEKRFHLKTYNK